jgi:hypothetical protein
MLLLRSKTMRFLLLLTLFVVNPAPAAAQSGPGQFLVISDIHFDPFYDPALFDQLNTQPVDNWGGILETSQPPGFNPIGTDSNFDLLESTLDEVCRRSPAPDFILYAGDFLAHHWQSKYDSLARQSHRADPQPFRAFTSKAIQFLAAEFRRRYPQTPILLALGNDDSYCGDYRITPDGPFLKMVSEAWAPLLGSDADRQAFRTTFSQGGHYSLRIPRMKDHRLIVLNSVFFSNLYDNLCGKSTQTPALDQLGWLAETLEQARAAGEAVWLLMHIPPGIDSFSSAKSVPQGGPPVTFWQPELTSRYLQLVESYQATIRASFVGHTHRDDFRVIRLNGKPVLFSKIAPAISPIFGNHPGYQVYEFDRRTGVIQNYQTYYLTNLTLDGKPTEPAAGVWALEYDFHATYGFSALDPITITLLADAIKTTEPLQQLYLRFHSVSTALNTSASAIDVYRCAITNATPAEFQLCYRGAPQSNRSPPDPGRKSTVGSAPSQ